MPGALLRRSVRAAASAMLILLPPSEGKAAPPRRGRPVDLDRLSRPGLGWARRQVLDALVRLSGTPEAPAVLGVGSALLPEVRRNGELERLPARPAAEVYTGVLYAALDLASLPPAARRRAQRSVVVQSALWGPIGLADRIPPYRLSIGTTLPGVGPLPAFWRSALATTAPAPGLILDCRSTAYAAAWRPAGEIVTVRVLTEVDGRLAVVSHAAKQTRGLVARRVLAAPRSPRSAAEVAQLLSAPTGDEPGLAVELQPERSGWRLDVISAAARAA